MFENLTSVHKGIFSDALLSKMPGILIIYDENGNLIWWNKKLEELLGYNSKELENKNLIDLCSSDLVNRENMVKCIDPAMVDGKIDLEIYIQTKNEIIIPMYFFAVRLEEEGRIYFTGMGINLSGCKLKEQEFAFLSYHDVLTGLYNRRFYEEELRRIDTSRNFPISIIIGDVNGLKIINDAFGHAKGDELLRKAASAIQKACRIDDIIARWGGDEFIILLPKTTRQTAAEIVQRIDEICMTETVNSIELSIAFGIDTKVFPKEDIMKVIKNAEDIMYKNKITKSAGVRSNIVNSIIKSLYEKSPVEEIHAKYVAELCKRMGLALCLSEKEISQLMIVGCVHDIGKISVEECILNKDSMLDDREKNEVKKHSDSGFRILSTTKDMTELSEYVLLHHERWDGKGYPKGISGYEIPLFSRILSIVDAYETMTGGRPYRETLSTAEAIGELRKNAGTQFDPKLAAVFVEKVLGSKWET